MFTEFDNNSCNFTLNPWCGQFGLQQYFEVFILMLMVGLGVLGNLLVILSIVIVGRTYKNGNIFIINLAIADLLVSKIKEQLEYIVSKI